MALAQNKLRPLSCAFYKIYGIATNRKFGHIHPSRKWKQNLITGSRNLGSDALVRSRAGWLKCLFWWPNGISWWLTRHSRTVREIANSFPTWQRQNTDFYLRESGPSSPMQSFLGIWRPSEI